MKYKFSNSVLFVWILLIGNIITIGMYFSGSYWLQQIIAPSLAGLGMTQSREFGMLESIQNVLLISIVILLIMAVIQRKDIIEKLFFSLGLSAFTFLLLEEMDYGLHYYELITEQIQPMETRNWHNQWNEGVENATRLKRVVDTINFLWFVVIPLLCLTKATGRFRLSKLRGLKFIPSPWFIVGFIIALLCSKVAHYLDDNGYSIINGTAGNLTDTIAEFRETSLYYLYLIYVIQLFKTSPLWSFEQDHQTYAK